jgi:hypothetical protein
MVSGAVPEITLSPPLRKGDIAIYIRQEGLDASPSPRGPRNFPLHQEVFYLPPLQRGVGGDLISSLKPCFRSFYPNGGLPIFSKSLAQPQGGGLS